MVEYFQELGVERLIYAIGTHSHEDHVGGLDSVIEHCDPEYVMLPEEDATTKTYRDVLTSIEDCGRYLLPLFYGKRNEVVYLLCLDAKCKVLSCKMIGEGSVNSAGVPIRRIVEMALAANATSVVLAHNHPSGLAFPSDADIQTTRRVAVALDAVEIGLLDHIVVADDDYISMAQAGCYRAEECCAMVYQEVTGWTDSN